MNCPKHVEFYSNNNFEKLEYLAGLSIRIYHDARSPERQISCSLFKLKEISGIISYTLQFSITFSGMYFAPIFRLQPC